MNLTELFEERSTAPPDAILHDLRMAGVRRRVIRRRRRIAAGLAAVLLVTAMVGVGTTLPTHRAVDPASTVEGFPDYYEGSRTIAATADAMPEPLTLTVVPTTPSLRVFWRCDTPPPGWLFPGGPDYVNGTVEIDLNGELVWTIVGSISCNEDPNDVHPSRWILPESRPGEPVTFTVTLVGGPVPGAPIMIPDRTTWGFAVAEPVPFEEYEFPPRPDPLPPLARPDCDYPDRELYYEPGAPHLPAIASLELAPTPYRVQVLSQTPGRFTISIDDQELAMLEFWDYYQRYQAWNLQPADLRRQGLLARPGDQVTITVTPEHATGDWALVICQ